MQGTNYINSAVNSNRQMYQNLSKQNPFANKTQYTSSNKIQYYNDEVAIKKEKKKKLNKKLVALFTGISAIGLIATTAVSIYKKKNADVFHAIKSLMKDGKLQKEGYSADTIKKAESIYNKYETVFNLTTNFGSIRDDYADRLVNKTEGTPFGFIKKWADDLKGLYNKWTHDGAIKSYAVAKENLSQTVIDGEGIEKFDVFFDDRLLQRAFDAPECRGFVLDGRHQKCLCADVLACKHVGQQLVTQHGGGGGRCAIHFDHAAQGLAKRLAALGVRRNANLAVEQLHALVIIVGNERHANSRGAHFGKPKHNGRIGLGLLVGSERVVYIHDQHVDAA